MTHLQVQNLQVGYGETKILHNLSLEVPSGRIVCLLGRNGAGKTTLLRSLIGLTSIWQGTVHLDDTIISDLPSNAIAKRGLGYMPQEKGVFPTLSVQDNLRLGNGRQWGTVQANAWLEYFPVLHERLNQKAGTLSGGEQKMLTLTRVLMRRPKMLLLDEPTEGVQPSIVQTMIEVLQRLNREAGTTILLTEQHLDFALALAHRYYVLEKGEIVDTGAVADLKGIEQIRKYLVV